MLTTRPIALTTLLIAVGAFTFSGYKMGTRIAAFNETKLAPTPFFQPVVQTSFTFAGRPVRIRTIDGDPTRDGRDEVEITFGDETITLNETIDGGVDDLQTLARHREWLRVFRFALAKGKTPQEIEEAIDSNEIDDRLTIVRRIPPPGADSSTWAEVWAKGWRFDLYELRADGTIAYEQLAYPSGRSGRKAKPGELVQGTWQFHAALLTMPPRRGPKPQFSSDAVGDFGWTHAGVGFSAVVAAVAAAFFFAPRKPLAAAGRREEESRPIGTDDPAAAS
ncbi:MAG: hypothetical protein AAFR96_00480 [Planctomycetota bacterium]